MKKYTYVLAFIVPPPFDTRLLAIEKRIAIYTGTAHERHGLPLHIDFHSPIENIDEKRIISLARAMSEQVRQTVFSIDGLSCRNGNDIIFPCIASRSLSTVWVGIVNLMASIPECASDSDANTMLRISMASGIEASHATAWPTIRQNIFTEWTDVPIKELSLYRIEKDTKDAGWELLRTFPLRAP